MNDDCMICGGQYGQHTEFLGKPCPLGLPKKGPLMQASEALKMYREAVKQKVQMQRELAEIRELERLFKLERRA